MKTDLTKSSSPLIAPPRSISDQAYEILKERILIGEIWGGERILESSVAELLQTSRTPVREAFSRLIQDGLVEKLPQGGVRVTPLTAQLIREVYGIRAVLEEYAGDLVCDNITSEILRKMKEMVPEARKILASENISDQESILSLWRLNTGFHDTIYRAAGSEMLLKTIQNLKQPVLRLRFLTIRKTRIRAWNEHERIIQYLEGRDKESLKRLMKEHTLTALSDALKSLENDRWEDEESG